MYRVLACDNTQIAEEVGFYNQKHNALRKLNDISAKAKANGATVDFQEDRVVLWYVDGFQIVSVQEIKTED